MRRKQKEICMVEFCEDEAISLGLCDACYHRMRYWNNRPLRDKMFHMKRMQRCEASLNMQMGNVKMIKPKRRKRA